MSRASAHRWRVEAGKLQRRLAHIRISLQNQQPPEYRVKLESVARDVEERLALALAEVAALPVPAPIAPSVVEELAVAQAMVQPEEPIAPVVAVAPPRTALLRSLAQRTPRELAGQLCQSLELLRRRVSVAERATLELVAVRVVMELAVQLEGGAARSTAWDAEVES